MLLGDAGTTAMPVVADLHQHRHQHVAEQVERTEDGRQTRDLPIDRGRRRTSAAPRRARRYQAVSVAPGRLPAPRSRPPAARPRSSSSVEPGEPPDAVSLLTRRPQQPQASDVGIRVHPPALVADRG